MPYRADWRPHQDAVASADVDRFRHQAGGERFGPAAEFNKRVVRISTRADFEDTLAFYLNWRSQFEDESGERRFSLRLVGSGKGVVIGHLSGIADRNQAEAARGLRLYLSRAALPPTEEDEYYHADLIGLAAVLTDGTPVGAVRAVHDFGAGDTLEIDRPEGPPVMVPFTRAIVPSVDLAAGRLVVDPPPGLLDGPERARPKREREPKRQKETA
jgi:16S rRNA processing protein RimM